FRHIVDGSDLTDPVLRALRPHVGDDAWCFDIGANIGLYCLGLATLAPRGRVFAFEPSPGSLGFLRANVQQNGADNVEVVARALADHEGTIAFHDVPFFSAGSFTTDEGSWLGSDAVGSTLVEVGCTTLDAFVESRSVERVDVLKIDVEGAEVAVLDGGARTLAAHRPTVVMEFNSFAFTLHAGTLPQAALTKVLETFPHVFVIDRADGSLARLATPTEAYQFLYVNGIHGPTDNLLCSFTDLDVERRFALPDALAGTATPDSVAAARELEAMRRTVSWRVTAPLRAVRAGLDRVPAMGRWLARER
ncbi:MAG TPA: FkbM family methyltransferase, partial [Acidimicrobiales bacterium]|nr:FkbM family methyltransferase [Acidimicrobiales bacterium]